MSDVPVNATGSGIAGSGNDSSVSRPLFSDLAKRITKKFRHRIKEVKSNAPRKKPKPK